MGSQTTIVAHDIFLSHSGKQKGFVKDLHNRLSLMSYTVFFDITDHSLPPAQKFPPRIFEAARNCKLAVVVLSDDFVVSYWPMLELCAFVRAAPSVQILPLFYKLSPSDLKNEVNLKIWRKAWDTHAVQQSNSRHTLDVLEWEKALKSLCSLNGIIFDPCIEGEQAYLDQIVSKISKIVPPAVKYDNSGIHGKDRLCKIVLAEFGELEVRMLQVQRNQRSVRSQCGVCVLAMCGPPGSGKSTLCKCLCNHYFPYFDGKAHYIEFPTNPTNEQLVKIGKELLHRLTNFRNMVDLTHVSDLSQINYVLRTSNLPSSKIFLVLDNISEETLVFVQKLLRFGVGPGSKVLLVARSLDVLESFIDSQKERSHYVCASMNVPSLDEKEAIRVLLQSRDNVDLEDHDLIPHDRQIMEKVVRMSGFGTEQQRLYLPLVMKIMGVQLRRYKLDVKQWGRDMASFWTRVKKCKQRAVMELVQESFVQLPEHLQLLFLDLALFIPRLPGGLKACDILSIMHDRVPDDIIMDVSVVARNIGAVCTHLYMESVGQVDSALLIVFHSLQMHDLQRHCFVESVHRAEIHDVFLEFAASIPESSSMYYYISCRWSCSHEENMLPPPSSSQAPRVVVLELHEGHDRFDFWPGISNVKVLILRNCKELAVLGLKGLTSLSILHIDNCPSLKSVELPTRAAEYRNLCDSIQRLEWVDTQGEKNMVMQQKKSNNMVHMYAEQGKQLVSTACSWFAGMIGASHIGRPAKMEVSDFAFQMRRLQALDLQNTGIKHLGDLSMCWPLLKELTIIEKSLEHIEVGMLPCLKSFVFVCDDEVNKDLVIVGEIPSYYYNSRWRKLLKASPRGFKNKNLLEGCPALELVTIRSASFEDGLGMQLGNPNLRKLWLANFWHAEKLPNLGACAESLELLVAQECGELRSVDFMYQFERLVELILAGCPSTTEVSGLDCLPNLEKLYINNCINLRTSSGLSGLVSLIRYDVGWGCPSLQVSLSDLEGLTNLQTLHQHCKYTLTRPEGFNVRKLVSLEILMLFNTNINGANLVVGLESLERLKVMSIVAQYSDKGVTCETHCHTLLGVPEPPHLSGLTSIYALHLQGVRNLRSLRGIEFLPSLEDLELNRLQNLSCLQGIESLTNLGQLVVTDCESVEELPNLSQLVNMRHLCFHNCVKLRSVEGCGAMTNLTSVALTGCESMACFPSGLKLRESPKYAEATLRVEGSKFARRDVLVSWTFGKEMPVVVHKSCVIALVWELCGRRLREKLAEEAYFEPWVRLHRFENGRLHYDRHHEQPMELAEQVLKRCEASVLWNATAFRCM